MATKTFLFTVGVEDAVLEGRSREAILEILSEQLADETFNLLPELERFVDDWMGVRA